MIIVQNLSLECASDMGDAMVKWSDTIENIVRYKINMNFEPLGLSADLKTSLTDCLMEKYAVNYPEGVPFNIARSITLELAKACANSLGFSIPDTL